MQALIKHKVNATTTVVFDVNIEHYKADDWNEYLEFNKDAKIIRASNGEEIIEVNERNIVLRTPRNYNFNVVQVKDKPQLNIDKARLDWRYRRLNEVRTWLTYGKSMFEFGAFAALGHVLIAVDSYARTITIYAHKDDEVII